MFYMLFYALLRIDRLGQRGLADVFSSPFFRFLFHYQGKKKRVSHSSLSERLSVINAAFFERAYECIYNRFSSLYTKKEISGMYLQRVDSSLVRDCSGHLRNGLTCGNEYKKGKMLKYTINFDGMFGSCGAVHSDKRYASECKALPENIISHCKKSKDHANIYIIDRGQSSAEAFKVMNQTEGLKFVGRLLEKRTIKRIEDKTGESSKTAFTHGALIEDSRIQLYKMEDSVGKKGQAVRKQVLVKETFRLVRFRPSGKNEDILLITNITEDMSADEIASVYRRRWDIEVFFRFIKQELNFSHFLSLSENGIQVVLYMTLITAMLVMIYKKENEIGYKTAVRRMGIEMEDLIIAMAVQYCGGDLRKIDLPYP
jgi:hypothetical protein